jgi:hypothetical protein
VDNIRQKLKYIDRKQIFTEIAGSRWFAEPISSTLKMEAICSSETSVETQRNTLRHIPEDDTLHKTFLSENRFEDASTDEKIVLR